MSTSNWIKIIGIVCIILGASGFLNSIAEVFMIPYMLETQQKAGRILPEMAAQRFTALAYGKIAVNLLYLSAGIFFLLRKSFSVKLMVVALTASIVYFVVPALFFREYSLLWLMDVPQQLMVFSFIGPVMDAVLLWGVYRVSKNYLLIPEGTYTSPQVVYYKTRILKYWTLAGVAFVLVPLTVFGLWLYIADMHIAREAKVDLFQSYFPGFLHGQWSVTYMTALFSLGGIMFSSKGLSLAEKWWRITNITVLSLSILFLLWSLFALM